MKVLSGSAEVSDSDVKHPSPREIANGFRLSCRAKIHAAMEIRVPDQSDGFTVITEGIDREITTDNAVKKRHIILEKQGTEDKRPDLKRVADAMGLDSHLRTSRGALKRTAEHLLYADARLLSASFPRIDFPRSFLPYKHPLPTFSQSS